MKCTQCGKETGPGKACERCGEELPPQKEVEVEYKEFSISELLDIKMVKKASAAQTDEKGKEPEPLSREEPRLVEACRTEEKSGKKTSLIVILTVIIVVLAAIIGLYLDKYLPGF